MEFVNIDLFYPNFSKLQLYFNIQILLKIRVNKINLNIIIKI